MRRRAAMRLAGLLLTLGLLTGGAAGVLVALAPLPARGLPVRALLKNGYAQAIDAGTGPIWILAVGSDARPGENILEQRADSIHLIGVNPATGAGVLLGFPRDSYLPIPGYGTDKINGALTLGGPQAVAATVAEATGITPQYVFITGFEGLVRMIDRLGGVTVNVDVAMSDVNSGSDFQPGPNKMDGGQALAFTRDRYVPSADFRRSKHQGDLLVATLLQMVGQANAQGKVEHALEFLLDDTLTDVPPAEVYRLARVAMTIDPAKIANCVTFGSVGDAGGVSIVSLDPTSMQAVVEDIAPDATADLGCPPLPTF